MEHNGIDNNEVARMAEEADKRKRIQDIPLFYYDESRDTITAAEFFRRAERAKTIARWDDITAMEVVGQCLRDKALRWFNMNKRHEKPQDWTTFQRYFNRAFNVIDVAAYYDFKPSRTEMKTTESVMDYYYRLLEEWSNFEDDCPPEMARDMPGQTLAPSIAHCTCRTEEQKAQLREDINNFGDEKFDNGRKREQQINRLAMFVSGLKSSIKKQVTAMRPTTVEQALEIADRLHKAEQADSSKRTTSSIKDAISEILEKDDDEDFDEEQIAAINAKFNKWKMRNNKGRSNAIQQNGSRNNYEQKKRADGSIIRDGACSHCGIKGHWAKECYRNPANKQNNSNRGGNRGGNSNRGRYNNFKGKKPQSSVEEEEEESTTAAVAYDNYSYKKTLNY